MGAERRTSPRNSVALPPGLRLTVPSPDGGSRAVMAKLIDVSDNGVGIETFVRIPSGVIVSIKGHWWRPDLSLHIDGRARVAHVSELQSGRFKIGLQFIEVALARSA